MALIGKGKSLGPIIMSTRASSIPAEAVCTLVVVVPMLAYTTEEKAFEPRRPGSA